MKKIIGVLLVIIFFCLINVTIVTASNTNAELVTDKNVLKPGDTFTITLKANCSEGLGFISTKLNINNKVTLISKSIANDWVDYGTDKLELFSNSSNVITSLDACTWTFKVNENAENGTIVFDTTNIEVTDINNAEYNLGPAEKRLTIKAEENQQEENDGNNNQEQGEQKNENHQETGSVTEQKEENKKNSEVKESSNKDTSVSNKIIPKAGKTSIILVAIIVLVGVCIALAIKSKKINN